MSEELPPIAFLRAFSRAAETLSFKEAAADLALSPSAVSRQIQSLEAHLGVALFRRLNPGLEITDEGRRYLEIVNRVLGELRRAQEGFAVPRSGPLRVSALESFTESWLIPHLADFERAASGHRAPGRGDAALRRLRARPGRRRDPLRDRPVGRPAQRADRRPDVLPGVQPGARSHGEPRAARARRPPSPHDHPREPDAGRVARVDAPGRRRRSAAEAQPSPTITSRSR